MQEIMNQILEGNFDYENGSLDFSCAKIELSIQKGQIYEGSFHIYGEPGTFTSGTVLSSDRRMECLNTDFVGTDEEISYCFHGEHLEEGEVVKGDFYVLSNHGEYYIPFVVSVERAVMQSSLGSIKNLFHFANLAKSNWTEAVKLFYSPAFESIFSGSDAQYAEDFYGLSACKGSEQNVEEFLIQINKKQRVEFLVEEEGLALELSAYDLSNAVLEREITIIRNGWGYTRLYVECTGDFLFTEKEVVTDDEFLGTYCRLPVYIDTNYCRKGKNFGEICLFNSYVTLRIPVVVKVEDNTRRNHQELIRKRTTVELMEFYIAYRMRKIGTATWLKETGKLVDKLVAMDEKDIAARLFQTQMLITEDRINEAGWMLDHVSDLFVKQDADDTLRAYYLYLTTLVHNDSGYTVRATGEVEHIYRQNNTNWRVGWLLLYLSENIAKSVTGKWMFLEKQFRAGCCSPMIYMEALVLLNNNPTLLRKLGAFEQQVLLFGARREALKGEVLEQLLAHVGKVKEYSEVLYMTMQKLYAKKKDTRLLQEICTLLIKGAKMGRQYFEWYSAGVEAQLRITNLYEYYMMSLDLNRPGDIPKIVLMYFSYQNNLDYAHSAYLYDYILQNKEKLGEIYDAYRVKIEHFAGIQIQKGRINRHLANIYNQLLSPAMINEQNGSMISRLLFAHTLRVEDDRLKKVYVYHRDNRIPEEYALVNGCAWVSLYGNNYTIVFEDEWQNRFVKNVEYTKERLMMPSRFLNWVLPFAQENIQLDFYMCDLERIDREDAETNLLRIRRLVEYPGTEEKLKRELYTRILQYYLDKDDRESLNAYLTVVAGMELPAKERNNFLKIMVVSGNYDMAEGWIAMYGPNFAEPKLLLRLLTYLLEQSNMEENAVWLEAAVYVFKKGKYDSTLLEYLNRHYKGMTKRLRDVWKAARDFELNCYELSERILVQMLYSGAFVGEKMDIFRYYLSQGAKPEVEETMLAQCAYDYFVRERVTESEVFAQIRRICGRGEDVSMVSKLAYLKYCSEFPGTSEVPFDDLAESFLWELMSRGIHLDFFKDFKNCEWAQRKLTDKTIIEYHATPGSKVVIHYVVLRENGESEKYVAEPMQDVCGSVFFKEFVLFFGESLQYYITEEKDGEEQLTESGTLQKSDIGREEDNSKFGLINGIVISKNLQDYETMDNLLEEYYRREYLGSRLFVLK